MADGLTFAEQMRVRIALNGGVRLDLDREEAVTLLRVIEREDRMTEAENAINAALANMQAEHDRVLGDAIGATRIVLVTAWIWCAVAILV